MCSPQRIVVTLKSTLLGLLLICQFWHASAADVQRYIHPPGETVDDHRFDYYWEILEAALEATKAQGPYQVVTASAVMNGARQLIALSQTADLSVIVSATSPEREEKLLPIRIPLDKGLTGYRLFLITADKQEQLSRVMSIDELKSFKVGQGIGWIDASILTSAGFSVDATAAYTSLFDMLHLDRFSLFPRGINEIGMELATGQAKYPNIVVEKKLILYYPLPRYFFFARTAQGQMLATRVEYGLNKLIKNGGFEKHYQRFKSKVIADVKLSGRRVFRIPNPTLSEATPLARTELWDNLKKETGSP
jgi:hypothetical protein